MLRRPRRTCRLERSQASVNVHVTCGLEGSHHRVGDSSRRWRCWPGDRHISITSLRRRPAAIVLISFFVGFRWSRAGDVLAMSGLLLHFRNSFSAVAFSGMTAGTANFPRRKMSPISRASSSACLTRGYITSVDPVHQPNRLRGGGAAREIQRPFLLQLFHQLQHSGNTFPSPGGV